MTTLTVQVYPTRTKHQLGLAPCSRYHQGPPPGMSAEDAQADRADVEAQRCLDCGGELTAKQYHRHEPYGYMLLAVCRACGTVDSL